jgi:hypothetical protein
LPDLLRRVAALTLVSAVGIALLAPLSARSALPEAALPAAPLLEGIAPPPTDVERGLLAVRSGSIGLAVGEPVAIAEQIAPPVLPTPAVAHMEATLYPVATPAPTPPPAAPRAAPAAAPPAGDAVWDALAKCESGGNWSINTGNGYYGGLQFSYHTWHGYGGAEFAEYPHEATREEQIVVAERLRARRGYQPWPACRAKLGLP